MAAEAARRGISSELLASRMVGRWPSGAPMVLAPRQDNARLAEDWRRNNDFGYAGDPLQHALERVHQAYRPILVRVGRKDDFLEFEKLAIAHRPGPLWWRLALVVRLKVVLDALRKPEKLVQALPQRRKTFNPAEKEHVEQEVQFVLARSSALDSTERLVSFVEQLVEPCVIRAREDPAVRRAAAR